MRSIKLEAPAKINLCLEVLGRRRDGYHEIATILQAVDLCDVITIREKSKGVRLAIDAGKHIGPGALAQVPLGKENLVCRAARLFLQESGIKKGVEIHLEKNIPIGAGLGGGSSDAAAVLAGLNRLWKAGFSNGELRGMGENIGMDVPFFIGGGMAFATGRGERLHYISSPQSFWAILIDPGFSVSTSWAYENIRENFLTKKSSCDRILVAVFKSNSIDEIGRNLFNTFERVFDRKHPTFLRAIKGLLRKEGSSGELLSGSGPVVFGIYDKRGDATRAFGRISRKVERVYLVRTRGGCENGNY